MTIIPSNLGPLAIGVAQPDELAQVMEIMDEAAAWLRGRGINQWPSPFPPGAWDHFGRRISEGQVYLARLESSGETVGTLRFEWDEPDLWPHDPTGGGYVHSLATRDAVRGHRIGATLLEWAAEHIREQGRPLIRLDCWDQNPALCAYYEALGFRRCGSFEHKGWTGARFEKEVPPREIQPSTNS